MTYLNYLELSTQKTYNLKLVSTNKNFFRFIGSETLFFSPKTLQCSVPKIIKINNIIELFPVNYLNSNAVRCSNKIFKDVFICRQYKITSLANRFFIYIYINLFKEHSILKIIKICIWNILLKEFYFSSVLILNRFWVLNGIYFGFSNFSNWPKIFLNVI